MHLTAFFFVLFNKNMKKTNIDYLKKDRLLKQILYCIEKRQQNKIKREIFLSFLGLLISLTALPFVFDIAIQDFSETGFVYFFNIIISHFNLVPLYFKQFGIVLLESLPILGLLLILTDFFILLISLKNLLKNYHHLSLKFLFSHSY